jgi:hypothetical protein
LLSVTPTVNVQFPELEGIPEIAPVVLLRERPSGSEPAVKLQV